MEPRNLENARKPGVCLTLLLLLAACGSGSNTATDPTGTPPALPTTNAAGNVVWNDWFDVADAIAIAPTNN